MCSSYLLGFIVYAAVGAVGQEVSMLEGKPIALDGEQTISCFTSATPEAAANQAAAAAALAATTKATATAAWATKSAAAAVMQATGRRVSAVKRAGAINTAAHAAAAKKETRMLKKAVADAALHRAKHMKVIYHERTDAEAEIIRKTHASMVKIEADHQHGLAIAKHAMDKEKSSKLASAMGTAGLRAAEATVLANTKTAFGTVRTEYRNMMKAAKEKYDFAKGKANLDSFDLEHKLTTKAAAVKAAAEKLALHKKDRTIAAANAKEAAEKSAAEAKRQQELGRATSAAKIAEMEAWVGAVSTVTGATKLCS